MRARAAVIAALAAPAAAARTRALFDDTFRFLLGDPRVTPPCDPATFTPLNGTQCLGFSETPAASAAACRDACCASGACGAWTYATGAGCWTGSSCASYLNDSHWVGGVRTAAPAPPACNAGDPCAVDYDDSAWRALSVPHDYGVEAAFDPALPAGKGALPKNASWYRKSFVLPADASAGDLVYLEFDGVFRAADIFLNGAFVAHHEEGYTPFIVWLHNATAPARGAGARNVLAVFVDARAPELWSYEGMGITRHVWLHTAPALGVVPWSFFAPAQLTGAVRGGAGEPQTADGALLAPQVDIANAGAALAEGNVSFSLADAAGAVVCAGAAPFSVAPGGWARVTATLACGSAAAPVRLWNTAPGGAYLHTASATLVAAGGGAALDAASARVGLRAARFTAEDGFTLNGAKVVLRGFSNHVGFAGCGGAVPDRVLEFQLTMLQSVGGNSIRTAHNPVAREMLDLADEYGVLIWEENRFVELGVLPSPRRAAAAAAEAAVDARTAARAAVADDPAPPPAAVARLLQDAQDMVLRDRNHASIVIWSLCNELGCESNNPMGHVIAAQFKQALYYADPSRPVTGNIVQRPYLGGRLIDEFGMAMDVTAFSHENENVPAYRALNTWKSVGLGESGSCESDRGEYAGNKTAGHMGFNAGVIACFARDMETLALPYNFGAYSWTLNDYLGETSWPATISHYGIFDNAGFAKDAAGYFTAAWAQPPDCTAIALGNSDWTAPVAPGAPVDVVAYTCAPAAELFLNGASLGVQQSAGSGAATWPRVAFAAGNLTALARDGAGAPLGAATLLSAGAPARLRLWVEDAYRAPRNGSVIAADGADVALLGVAVEDAAGRRVPAGAVNVTFSVVGPAAIYGVGNGDPADHAPVKFAASRRTFHGLARVIIQSTGAPGGIVVTATAPGVLQATAALVAE